MEGVIPLDQEAHERHHHFYRYLSQDVVEYDVGAKFTRAPQKVLLAGVTEKRQESITNPLTRRSCAANDGMKCGGAKLRLFIPLPRYRRAVPSFSTADHLQQQAVRLIYLLVVENRGRLTAPGAPSNRVVVGTVNHGFSGVELRFFFRSWHRRADVSYENDSTP